MTEVAREPSRTDLPRADAAGPGASPLPPPPPGRPPPPPPPPDTRDHTEQLPSTFGWDVESGPPADATPQQAAAEVTPPPTEPDTTVGAAPSSRRGPFPLAFAVFVAIGLIIVGIVLMAGGATNSSTSSSDPVAQEAAPSQGTVSTATLEPTPPPSGDPWQGAIVLVDTRANALAAGDWATVRRLDPDSPDDDELEERYGAWDDIAVVPVRSAQVGPSRFGMRLGLIVHESPDGVPQTSLLCVHWAVDAAVGTVQPVDSRQLGVETGTVPPENLQPTVSAGCSAVALN